MVRIALSYVALLALLALTVVMSFVPLGATSLAIALGISLAKMGLIMLFFMQLDRASDLVRIVAVAGFVWLALLFVLSFSDYGIRMA